MFHVPTFMGASCHAPSAVTCQTLNRTTVCQTAGATVTRPAAKTFHGGYPGFFTDLDGHASEIAHNPIGNRGSPIAPGRPRAVHRKQILPRDLRWLSVESLLTTLHTEGRGRGPLEA